VRASLHLDLRHDAVFYHARDDAGEMIPSGTTDGDLWFLLGRFSGHEPGQLPAVDDPLPT
jgi:hypothetical protein